MNKLFYTLAAAALLAIFAGGTINQAPPEPNCTLDPEACTKK